MHKLELVLTILFGFITLFSDCKMPGNVYYGKKADGNLEYSKESPVGLQQCVRMCYLEGPCKSVIYNRIQLSCHLLKEDVQPEALVKDDCCFFVNNITGTQVFRFLTCATFLGRGEGGNFFLETFHVQFTFVSKISVCQFLV
jgi:hypothetical protein